MYSPPGHRTSKHSTSRIHNRMSLVDPARAFEGKTVVGIDPGVTPAIACFFGSPDNFEIHDDTSLTAGKKKATPNIAFLGNLLDGIQPDVIVMEHVTPMPQWGAITTASFIGAFRHMWGFIEGRGLPLLLLPPKKWQQIAITTAGGEYHRTRATQLFPQHAHLLRRKKDHNRGAAMLIALAGAMVCRGNSGGYMGYHLVQDHYASAYWNCWGDNIDKLMEAV